MERSGESCLGQQVKTGDETAGDSTERIPCEQPRGCLGRLAGRMRVGTDRQGKGRSNANGRGEYSHHCCGSLRSRPKLVNGHRAKNLIGEQRQQGCAQLRYGKSRRGPLCPGTESPRQATAYGQSSQKGGEHGRKGRDRSRHGRTQ